MSTLSILNLVVFLAVTGYALYLFVHVVYSRITFIMTFDEAIRSSLTIIEKKSEANVF